MPAPADQMFLQLRAMHADELHKRLSNGCVIPKSGRAESLLTHPTGINNNSAGSLGSKEIMGTTDCHARLDSRPHMADR